MQSSLRYGVAALVILAATLIVYRGVVFQPDPAARYPWSSDAWGYLIKADYLLGQIEEGNLYPDLFPQWYSGQQMLRYYAPLPYYVLVTLIPLAGDTFEAGNWFLFLAALGGGLSMLLFARRFGLVFATLGGVLLVMLPDNIRVAFAEGNLPLVLAAALLPATFYFLLNLLTEERGRKLNFVGVAALMALVVLSHAMMGAILGACFTLFALAYWFTARAKARQFWQSILAVFAGVLLSGWWLLPSLTGGITDLNVEAASEALASFSLAVSLNPTLRWSDIETFYLGASFLLVLGLAAFYWRRLDRLLRSLLVVSLITGLISSTIVNSVYNTLPFHQLFWPLRFTPFFGFVLILLTVALFSYLWKASGARRQSAGRFLAVGLALVMLVDFWQSTPLAHTREAPSEVMRVAQLLGDSPGWRVATADLSLLGSSPSYLFSQVGGREQVYGWAYQGAATAPLLAQVNLAIERGYAAYAVDRLELLGADDVVALNTLPQSQYQVSPEFREALDGAGYEHSYGGDRVDVYHKTGAPRVYRLDTRVLGIGRGVHNLALLFPEIVVATETRLDSYDVKFLSEFDTLVLSGFDWNSKRDAEEIVAALASRGKRIVIDLTGTPPDVLSRIPNFLGVYGERIIAPEQPVIRVDGTPRRLRPYSSPDGSGSPWQAFVPQGLDTRDITFEMLGVQPIVVGTKQIGGGEATFLGLNLMFHAVLTRDPVAIEILERELGVKADRRTSAEPLQVAGYVAYEAGYEFLLEAPEEGYYLVPVARHAGTAVFVDGVEAPSWTVDTLTLAKLPAGPHRVEIRPQRTAIYGLGLAATGMGALIAAAFLLAGVRLPQKGFTFLLRGRRAPSVRF